MQLIPITNIKDIKATEVYSTTMKSQIDDPIGNGNGTKPQNRKKAGTTKAGTRKKKWKKPKDKPKRPLSAYNIFFRFERAKLLCSYNNEQTKFKKVGFAALAKHIAPRWKLIDAESRKIYEVQAGFEQVRYKKELDEWKRKQAGDEGSSSDERSSPIDTSLSNKISKRNNSTSGEASGVPPLEGNTPQDPSSDKDHLLKQQQNLNSIMDQNMVSLLMNSYNTEVPSHQQENTMGQWYPTHQQFVENTRMQQQANYVARNGSMAPCHSNQTTITAPWSMPMSNTAIGQQQQQDISQVTEHNLMSTNIRPSRSRSLSMPQGSIKSSHCTEADRYTIPAETYNFPHQHEHNYQQLQDGIGIEAHSSSMIEFGDIIKDIANMESELIPYLSRSTSMPNPSVQSETKTKDCQPRKDKEIREFSSSSPSPIQFDTKDTNLRSQDDYRQRRRTTSLSLVEQETRPEDFKPSVSSSNQERQQEHRRSVSMSLGFLDTTADTLDGAGNPESLDELYNFLKNDTDLFQC